MAKSARTPAKARAASIARAERLQRQAIERGESPKQPKTRPDRTRTPREGRKGAAIPARQDERSTAIRLTRPVVPHGAMRRDRAAARLDHFRADQEKQRQDRIAGRQRAEFNRLADRRQDSMRREVVARQRAAVQAFTQKAQRQRQAEQRKQAQQRGERMRHGFAQAADRRQQLARRASTQRHVDQAKARMQQAAMAQAERARAARARAAASIEQSHKRQRADQQAAHRWQTAQVRTRHQAETRSLRAAQNQALERHHHAVIGIDNREREALAGFDARRSSLTGRIAEAVPGRRAANDEARVQMVRGFESERLHKHRDLEALKERQFQTAQSTRLSQAKERLDIARIHQGDRQGLEHRQKAGRPELVKAEARTIQRVEREQSRDAGRAMLATDRERERPAPAFAKA